MPTSSPAQPDATFSLGVDGILVGDDGRGGLLAASLRYASRLAKALSHVLDLGALSHFETTGSRRVIAQVSWSLAGECRLRGEVIESRRPTAPPATAVADRMDAVIDLCLSSLESSDAVRWATLFRRDLPPLHTDAIPAGAMLGQIGLRTLGILSGIEEELRETCIWLGYERGTLVLAPVGPHCLVLSVDTARLDAVQLLTSVVETQARLAPHDLTEATLRPPRVPLAARSAGSVGIVGPPRLIGSASESAAPSTPRTIETLYLPGQAAPLSVGAFGSAVDAQALATAAPRRPLRRPALPLSRR